MNWFGLKYNDSNNLLDLHNDFTSGSIDKAAPVAQYPVCDIFGWEKTG